MSTFFTLKATLPFLQYLNACIFLSSHCFCSWGDVYKMYELTSVALSLSPRLSPFPVFSKAIESLLFVACPVLYLVQCSPRELIEGRKKKKRLLHAWGSFTERGINRYKDPCGRPARFVAVHVVLVSPATFFWLRREVLRLVSETISYMCTLKRNVHFPLRHTNFGYSEVLEGNRSDHD